MRRRDLLSALAVLPFAGAAKADNKNNKKVGGPGYLAFTTLTALIVRPDGQRGVLTVEAGIDTPDPALRERVMELIPRLRDAYTSSLQVFGANLRPGEAPDLDQLEARLQADTDRVVGRRGTRILLGTTLVN